MPGYIKPHLKFKIYDRYVLCFLYVALCHTNAQFRSTIKTALCLNYNAISVFAIICLNYNMIFTQFLFKSIDRYMNDQNITT